MVTVAERPIRMYRAIPRRVAAYWPFKLFVGGAIVLGFFAGYFVLQRFPIFQVTVMPMTALDRLVGYHPDAAPLYLSLWLYIPIAPWLAESKRELLAYSLVLAAMCAVGLLIFFLWPTVVPRPAVDAGTPLLLRSMVWVDGPGNACPSLHAAFAAFCALANHRALRRLGDRGALRLANGCWCTAILYATLATRQHVAIDLFCGVLLGVAAFAAFLRFLDRAPREQR